MLWKRALCESARPSGHPLGLQGWRRHTGVHEQWLIRRDRRDFYVPAQDVRVGRGP